MAKSSSRGSKIHREDPGTPGSWAAVAHVVDFSGFGGQSNEIDATDLDSTEAEFEPDIADPGTAQITMNVDLANAAQFSQIMADQQAGTVTRWALELPSKQGTNRYLMANGFVNSAPIAGGRGAMVTSGWGLRLSGARQLLSALPAS